MKILVDQVPKTAQFTLVTVPSVCLKVVASTSASPLCCVPVAVA